ncbi:MAG: ABC transporter permease [Spirochaetales bacterium]|nr:ABC transporter permease [Spirochaetales bacterium]
MAEIAIERAEQKKRRSAFLNFLIRLVKEKPLGTVGAVITLILLFVGIFADVLAPHGMSETHMNIALTPPGPDNILGTDNLGRDVLTRIIYGARISVIIGLSASSIATVLSLIIGMISGYLGKTFDLFFQRVVDTMMAVPQIIMQLIFLSIIGPGILQVTLVLGIMWGIIGSRIIRSAVISVRETMYVAAAESIGCSKTRIILKHILPNIMAPTIVLFTTRVPNVILVEASLSFLGYGIPPPAPSWGGMLGSVGRDFMLRAPWLVLWPGLALTLVVYGINMFGDAVRDLVDPRLKGGVGRYDAALNKQKKGKISSQ